MKLKLAVALAVLLFASLARADSQQLVVDATATSCNCGFGDPGSINLVAQLTVEQVTGAFFDSGENFLYPHATVYEVMSLSGTLNGSPVALAPPPEGIGSWLSEVTDDSGTSFRIGSVYFTANGSYDWLEDDGSYNLLEIENDNGSGNQTNNAIYWTAVDSPAGVPEPSSLLLSGMGLATLIGLVRRSRTKS